jgi:WD40 repeat protein
LTLGPGSRFGSFEIVSLLGVGGMGEVWRARDARLGRDVAIKLLPSAFAADAERVERFEREARLLASLNHPGIAAIHSLEEQGGVTALVLELVEGETLTERIHRGPLRLEQALPIAAQIADALEAAHERGIVHRDLKPANIKLSPDGRIKVLDFGLAKALPESAGHRAGAGSATVNAAATELGTLLGTPAYMAPEQALGDSADRRADIWAFGVVVCELLTGRALFRGRSSPEVLANVVAREPDLTQVPASVRPVLMKCLRKEPRERWQWIGDVRIALEEAAATPVAPATRQRSSRALAAVAAMSTVALAAVSYLHWSQSAPLPPVTRFTVPIPGGDALETALALSPDGRELAIAALQENERAVWIRPLDALEARRVPGTEGALKVFWAPTGDQLGFITADAVKRSAADGSAAPTTIALGTAQGVSWSRAGTLLLSGPTELLSVAAGGGTPQSVDSKAEERVHGVRIAHFLPDGEHFLAMVNRSAAADSGVWLGSLGEVALAHLLPDFTEPLSAVAANGAHYIVFRRGSTVLAQQFDLAARAVVGTPVEIAANVAAFPDLGAVALSGDGSTLAYIGGAPLELVWLDRAGTFLERAGTLDDVRTAAGWRLSPDNGRVAFSRDSGAVPGIWQLDLRRGSMERVTFGGQPNLIPVWSPDGARIAFASNRGNGFDPYVTAEPGAEELLVDLVPAGGWPLDWSPDGATLLQLSGSDIWMIDVATREAKPYVATPFAESDASFSPDGRWVAYTSNESGRVEVYLRTFPGAAARELISLAGGTEPAWRADGKELFYVGSDGTLVAVPVELAADSVTVGEPQRLFPGASGYQPARDGQRFLLARRAEPAAITVVLNWQNAIAE